MIGLALAIFETVPRAVAPGGAPDAAAAREALAGGEALRDFLETGDSGRGLVLRESEINALMASASRLATGGAASARLTPGGVAVEASLGAPYLPQGIWVNLGIGVTADADGARVEWARIGRLPLPAGLTQAVLMRAADRVAGPDFAQAVLAGVVGFETEGGALNITFDFAPGALSALVAQLRGRLNLPAEAEKGPVFSQMHFLHRAGERGQLPRNGSVLPYLGHGMGRIDWLSERYPDVSDRDQAAAAMLALAVYCGEPALGAAIGVSLRPRMEGDGNHCAGATLGGRDDLKRHFVVSAGLYALSTAQAALGIGELKELIDSGAGGTGFSFDDMAANLAGARFAAAFLSAPQAAWPAMRAAIRSESDILPSVADLPHGLTEAEFRERFGDVDSPEYKAMLAEIGRRIDALPFHRRIADR